MPDRKNVIKQRNSGHGPYPAGTECIMCYKSLPARFDVFLSVGTLKNRSFTAFGVSRSEIGIAGRNVTVTPWSGCDK